MHCASCVDDSTSPTSNHTSRTSYHTSRSRDSPDEPTQHPILTSCELDHNTVARVMSRDSSPEGEDDSLRSSRPMPNKNSSLWWPNLSQHTPRSPRCRNYSSEPYIIRLHHPARYAVVTVSTGLTSKVEVYTASNMQLETSMAVPLEDKISYRYEGCVNVEVSTHDSYQRSIRTFVALYSWLRTVQNVPQVVCLGTLTRLVSHHLYVQ